jgi:hypothetical protein
MLPAELIHKSDLLKAGVIITAYNPHVGSFFRALGLQKATKVYSVDRADFLMESR